ncbi:TRAP transporter small permease [Thermodesulfobacteriota bacterium]
MNKILLIWNRIGVWISGTTLFLMMSLTAVDVCGRYLFRHAIMGTNELTEMMMVIIIFLALSDTASSGGHITVEVVTSKLSLKKQLILKSITSFVSGIVAAAMAWRLGMNGLYAFKHPEITDVLEISKAYFISISAIGCGMLSIALIAISYNSLLQRLKNSSGNETHG